MTNYTKLLAAAGLSSLFLVGCGETTSREDVSLSSENYISVAKSVYAQQNGEERGIKLQRAVPGEELDNKSLYLTKSVKPRAFRIRDIEVTQGDQKLSIKVDASNKYATVTLSGDETAKQTVDMKTFTLPQEQGVK